MKSFLPFYVALTSAAGSDAVDPLLTQLNVDFDHPGGSGAGERLSQLDTASIDFAAKTVKEMIQLVNSSTSEVLSLAVKTGAGLESALSDARTSTKNFNAIIGDDAVKAGDSLFGKLGMFLQIMREEIPDAEERMRIMMTENLDRFTVASDSTKNNLKAARAALRETMQKNPSVFLQQKAAVANSAQSTSDWIFGLFNKPTRCQEVAASLSEVERNVRNMQSMLVQLNASLCTHILKGAVSSVGGQLVALKHEMDKSLPSYSSALPKSLLASLSEAVDTTTSSVVEDMHKSLNDAEVDVKAHMKEALHQNDVLRGVAHQLGIDVAKSCTATA